MLCKRLGFLAILLPLLAFPASASMVSFLLVETGLSEEVLSSQYTSLWEGGLMAAFFDAGHIVTNSPITRMEKRPERDFTGQVASGYREAVDGGSDYFVLGFLEYRVQEGRAVPVGIVLKLFGNNSQIPVCEDRFTVGSAKSLEDEYVIAQNAGKQIISRLSKR